MAEQTHPGSALGGGPAENLANADKLEGTTAPAGEHALDDPTQHHTTPTALGLDDGAWVALAMLVVLALLFWKKVPAAIGRALDGRIAAIRGQLDEAAQLRREAEALKAEYEAKAAAAEGEADHILARAQTEADAVLAKARSDAEALVERRTRMAEDKIAAAERSAVAEVRARAANAAAAAAAQLIAQRHDEAADRAMVDRAIAGLGQPN